MTGWTRHSFKKTLLNISFPISLINLIMKCINTVNFSILINGVPMDTFQPTIGIRQRSFIPLSVYNLCGYFFNLIRQAQSLNNFRGVSIARKALIITHLFFAADSLLFCQEEEHEANNLKDIITKCQESSGQKINFRMSKMIFSHSTNEQILKMFTKLLEIPMSDNIDT